MQAIVSLQNSQNFLILKLYETKMSGNENSHRLTHTKEEKTYEKIYFTIHLSDVML